jgi:hypothetical protein
MFPVLIGAAIAGLIAWAVRDKTTGVVGPGMGYDNQIPIPPGMDMQQKVITSVPLKQIGSSKEAPRLKPEQERLLSLLVLFARDKKYPAGQKRYLTAPIALEATRLAASMNLPKTSMAIRKDGPVPNDEFIPGRAESIRELTVKYGTTGRA